MASIGPQLPPHLTKRKRTPEDDAKADSPPSKRAQANKHKITLDDESSDDGSWPSGPQLIGASKPSVGPAIPCSSGTSKPAAVGPTLPLSIGPTLPPSNANANANINKDDIPLDESDGDSDTGPAPAPTTRSEPATIKRIHGPAGPNAALSERPPDSGSDSDSDDGYGPALPNSSSHQARQSEAAAVASLEAANPKAPQRDDWMLAPPTSGGYRAPDPTKLKARKFNSGPRGGGPNSGGSGGEISSIWTETPEQKRKRLENAVLGRADPSTESQAAQGPAWVGRLSHEEEERAERTRRNIEASRGRSLYAEHQEREGGKGGRIEEEEDDPSKRAFDKEKDMKVGGKIGTAQRRELITKAADFGGRFSKGKFL